MLDMRDLSLAEVRHLREAFERAEQALLGWPGRVAHVYQIGPTVNVDIVQPGIRVDLPRTQTLPVGTIVSWR